jgi:ribonuclease E
MLIDATHAEETRVVVLDGTRLEDFDVETSAKRHLKGNIYLAKVVRVEPSLQAAFVEYGGNRHGFLAFSEIHPDYYQIPIADRQRLLELEAEEARREEEEDELEFALSQATTPPRVSLPRNGSPRNGSPRDNAGGSGRGRRDDRNGAVSAPQATNVVPTETAILQAVQAEAWARPGTPPLIVARRPEMAGHVQPRDRTAEAWARAEAPPLMLPGPAEPAPVIPPAIPSPAVRTGESDAGLAAEPDVIGTESWEAPVPALAEPEAWARSATPALLAAPAVEDDGDRTDRSMPDGAETDRDAQDAMDRDQRAYDDRAYHDSDDLAQGDRGTDSDEDEEPPPETLGGDPDSVDEPSERRLPSRFLRNYKIQEVIRRRQILLVQVVKEERGTKGAALTTYLSLAGRFSVLMPNSPRGGGISRKITSAADRRRLKEVMTELDIPRGMGLIIRTAGAARPKPEIKRDCEYLLRLWDDIREHTLKSIAPAMIYEEASLIKRAIRDVYSRDIDEILVDGTEGWRAAHDFMRMLMPTHARKVQLWHERGQPLFARYQVEAQLDAMLSPTVQLRSGGYLVINQAEALVAIDVNSGRSTRERNVEETALRTNLEAADEVARQLRLRDLAGLIVIDFIDMESRRHNAMVERRLKDALRNDRARIQVGSISHFGLLEMSRQRLRPSLAETSFITCPHCGGTGHVRSTESAAIHVLRGIEDEASKRRAAEAIVHVATSIALYLLNHKRERLREIEQRYGMRVIVAADDTQISPRFRIERMRPQIAGEAPSFITPDAPPPMLMTPVEDIDEDEDEDVSAEVMETPAETVATAAADVGPPGETAEEQERRRRRRRRRRGRRDDATGSTGDDSEENGDTEEAASHGVSADGNMAVGDAADGDAAAGDVTDRDRVATIGDADLPSAGVELGVAVAATEMETGSPAEQDTEAESVSAGAEGDDDGKGRRRGRRGGRRRRRDGGDGLSPLAEPGADQPELPPVYAGPTPANPFGGQVFDIFDVMEQVEQVEAARAAAAAAAAAAPKIEPAEQAAPIGGWARAASPPLLRVVAPAPRMGEAGRPVAAEGRRGASARTGSSRGASRKEKAEAMAAAAPESAPATPVTPAHEAPVADVAPVTGEAPAPVMAVAEAPADSPAMPPTDAPAEALAPSAPTVVAVEAIVPAPPTDVTVEATVLEMPTAVAPSLAEAPVVVEAPAEPAAAPVVAEITSAPATVVVPEPANDVAPTSEPLIKPIVIGQDVVEPVERKRGWWRRS